MPSEKSSIKRRKTRHDATLRVSSKAVVKETAKPVVPGPLAETDGIEDGSSASGEEEGNDTEPLAQQNGEASVVEPTVSRTFKDLVCSATLYRGRD
jgi:hypothetical protein